MQKMETSLKEKNNVSGTLYGSLKMLVLFLPVENTNLNNNREKPTANIILQSDGQCVPANNRKQAKMSSHFCSQCGTVYPSQLSKARREINS